MKAEPEPESAPLSQPTAYTCPRCGWGYNEHSATCPRCQMSQPSPTTLHPLSVLLAAMYGCTFVAFAVMGAYFVLFGLISGAVPSGVTLIGILLVVVVLLARWAWTQRGRK